MKNSRHQNRADFKKCSFYRGQCQILTWAFFWGCPEASQSLSGSRFGRLLGAFWKDLGTLRGALLGTFRETFLGTFLEPSGSLLVSIYFWNFQTRTRKLRLLLSSRNSLLSSSRPNCNSFKPSFITKEKQQRNHKTANHKRGYLHLRHLLYLPPTAPTAPATPPRAPACYSSYGTCCTCLLLHLLRLMHLRHLLHLLYCTYCTYCTYGTSCTCLRLHLLHLRHLLHLPPTAPAAPGE